MVATSRMSSPGFFASSAAEIIRTRSMTRLRLGAPGAEKCRLRCSRLTPTSLASAAVRTGRPADARIDLHVASCIGLRRPSDAGGSLKAAANLDEKVRGPMRSRATASSIPSAMTSQNSRAAHRATAGASVARNGLIPKKGALGNSCARAPIFHVSSLVMLPVVTVPEAASPPAFAARTVEPTSTRAASTRVRRKTLLNSARSRTTTTRHLRFGNAERTSARVRSRGA